MMLYKGYVRTNDKKSIDKFKNVPADQLRTLEQVKDCEGYGGVLADDTILIDIDDQKQSDILMDIVEDEQLDCKVVVTSRGRHFLFKNTTVEKCYTGTKLACGLTADIKVGSKSSYEVLKKGGKLRHVEWDSDTGHYDTLPKWLTPVKTKKEFIGLDEGDGRNEELFSYKMVLNSAGFSFEDMTKTLHLINNYVFEAALPESEIETIARREDNFDAESFMDGKRFKHEQFADYLINTYHITKIDSQLHVFNGEIYKPGTHFIEQRMIRTLKGIRSTQRAEVLKYMDVMLDNVDVTYANEYIAFKNGVYHLGTDELLPFSPDYFITNQIPFNYNPGAYDELTDKTLNKIACDDPDVRALLEECIGYCFYGQNTLSKAFILTGEGSNGKSTYLDMIKYVLGAGNYSALDIKELSDRFSTIMLYGKMANIGDDIDESFLSGDKIALFKKIVSGNTIKAEQKGMPAFDFSPRAKLIFSANVIPRMRSKGFKAMKRRLVIIPFDAVFSKFDPDFDPNITFKLRQPAVAEYLINLAIPALKRALALNDFTTSARVQAELESFERENNPILQFLEDVDESEIIGHETKDVYARYDTFCAENGLTRMSAIAFNKEIGKRLGCEKYQTRDVNTRRRKNIFRYIVE